MFLCKILGHSYAWDSLYENHLCSRCGFDRTHGERDRFYRAVQEWEPGKPLRVVNFHGISIIVPVKSKPRLKLINGDKP